MHRSASGRRNAPGILDADAVAADPLLLERDSEDDMDPCGKGQTVIVTCRERKY